jgi:hypothetical protein
MKKITLWLFALFASMQLNAQTCSQTFTTSGTDSGPTVLTINASSLNCYGSNPLTGLTLKNAAGSLSSDNCGNTGFSWFKFSLSIDGGTPVVGCADVFNNLSITGFTTLTITSTDNDNYTDSVEITIDVEAAFTPLSIPGCVSLSNPANGALNVGSSVISWPAANNGPTGYFVSVGTVAGGTDVLELEDVGNVLTYNLGALGAGTTYFVTITPYNSNGDAVGCVETNFTTCGTFSLPFAENFNSTSPTQSCWTVLNVNGDEDTWNLDYNISAIEGNQSAMINTDYNAGVNNDYLISPKITLTGNQRLVFKYKVQTANEPNDFAVLLSSTGNAPANFTTTLVPLTSYSNNEVASKVVSLAGISGDVYIAWHVPAGGLDGWRLYIDEVVVENIPMTAPSCVAITAPVNNALNVFNPTITWASNIDATGYSISIGTASGATDIFELEDVGNVLSYTFPTDPGTTYYVTVFPYNSNGEATGCTEISFTTCDAISAPHLEQFNTFLPSCWQAADNGNLVTGPATFGTSGWVADGFGNVGTSGSIRYEIWLADANDWIISPVVEIPATGYELKFDAAATHWNTTAAPTTPWEADDKVEVLVSTSGFSGWNVLYTYNNTNVPAVTGTSNFINLDAYAGEFVRFAFRVVEGTNNGIADLNFYVDNFEIRETPNAVPTCATNIVATPNTTCGNLPTVIAWNTVEGADGYKINIGTTVGGTQIANNVNLGNSLTYSFVGNIATQYFYTIIPFNAVGAAINCNEMSFTTVATGCYCTPSYTTGISSGDLISNIVIAGTTLSNNSGTATTGTSYTFFTGQPNYTAELQAGSSYQVTATVGTFGNQNIAAWIDYNDNYTFEPSERIGFTTNSIVSNGSATFTITLACNPPLGNHRLRIRDVYNTSGNMIDPCASYGFGETEDYMVTITTAVACPVPSNLTATSITSAGATLGWNIGCSEILWDVHVDLAGSAAPTTSISNEEVSTNPLVLSGLTANTAYQYYVRANCGDTDGTSTWTGPFLFTTLAIPPANDSCANAIALTPGAVFSTNPVVGTNVGATNSNETAPGCASFQGADVWYSVVVPASGSITIETRVNADSSITDTGLAVYSGSCGALTLISCNDDYSFLDDAFSLVSLSGRTPGEVLKVNVWEYGGDIFGTFRVSAYDASLSTSSFDNANFKAYPNPVKDVLNLSYTSEISNVRVINLLGQEVISKSINTTSTQVDMSQLSAGAYIVNVTVADTIKTLKVVKQ